MIARLLRLFLLEVALGVAGAGAGSVIGKAMGPGGLIIGAVIGGVSMVVLAGILACRIDCVSRRQRFWVIAGGVSGFLVACMLALATISTPGAPLAASILIGLGAVFGAIMSRSPHNVP